MGKYRVSVQLLIFVVITGVTFLLFEAFAIPTDVLAFVLITALFLYFEKKLDRLTTDLRKAESVLAERFPEEFGGNTAVNRKP